jgi:type IX secretion system PorP/SprF family membrane protein
VKRLHVTFLFLLAVFVPGLSQQDPLTSNYMFNTLAYNPGVAGTSGMICATALNRQQWVGFKGAPSTTVFNISAPFNPFKISSGVGLIVESDNIGFDKDINLSLAYTYLTEIGQGTMGIGISAGMLNKTLDPTWEIPEWTSLLHPPEIR